MPRAETPTARLGWRLAGEWLPLDSAGPNRLAAEATLVQLRLLGRVELVDEAVTVAFELLAEAVDSDPTNAALWGQYRAAEAALRGLGNGDSDPFAQFLASLPAADSDRADRPADTRRPGREGGGSVQSSADAVAAVRGGRRKRAAP